jgi:hypothetical protein
MQSHTYTFTSSEMMTIRDALTDYYQSIKHLKPSSPVAIANLKNAEILKDEFKTDVSLLRD